ncbi:transcriptional repressor [Halalkalibacter wakoensis JCM 9140]|uniref:Transcriptional repressor n=2 Tax=Halalkalibacter wakoensis TaxID=127891 RepID=W4Q8M6_9BACI|nr:transcriptional repressor [Halalkalibacter wakoensis JCM 9140]
MSKILDGTFQPHQKIYTEAELMKQFDVSRHTVRVAIGELVTQGWLYREQGAGTFCVDRSEIEVSTNVSNQKNIAIITTYISDYIFPSIIRGAESYLSQHGYHVSLFNTNNNHESERRALKKILTQRFDGVIIEPTKSALFNPNINDYLNLERQTIPYIMINAYYDELDPLSITMNDEKGGYIQTDHLIELGHTDIIGFFKTDDIQGNKRMKGYLKAHREHEIFIEPSNIVTYSSEEKETKPVEILREKLSEAEDVPTAIVCYNDELAIRLLDVIREKNLQVPEDISIVGFDDSFLANVTEVKLTTIQHPKSKLGESAARMMLDIIKEGKSSQKLARDTVESIVIDPELMIRDSTKQINK